MNISLFGTSGTDTLDGGAGPDDRAGGASNETHISDISGDGIVAARRRAAERADSRGTSAPIVVIAEMLKLAGLRIGSALGGDDIYELDADADVTTEQPGEYRDRIGLDLASCATRTDAKVPCIGLSAGDSVTGNARGGTIYGASRDDFGNGGPGNDTTAGRAGNATYAVDSSDGVVLESRLMGLTKVWRAPATRSLKMPRFCSSRAQVI